MLYVTCERYQFVPSYGALDSAATSELLSLAHEIAEERGRHLASINEQRIRKSMGRNGVTGITSWSGMLKVKFDGEQAQDGGR